MENTEISALLERSHVSVNIYQSGKAQRNILKYLTLCFITVIEVLVTGMSFYITTEYAYVAIQEMRYPNSTLNTSVAGESLCQRNTTIERYKIQQSVQAEASKIAMYSSIAVGIPQVFATSSFSAMSDQYGRKVFLILPLAGAFIKFVLITLGIYCKLDIYIFLVFGAVEALTGGWIGTLAAGFAYIADLFSPGKMRSFAIATFDLLIGLGFAVASFVTGYLIKYIGFLFISLYTTVIIFLILIAGIAFIHEARCVHKQPKKKFNICTHYRNIFKFYTTENTATGGKPWKYFLLMTASNLIMMAMLGKGGVEVLFFMNDPICMTSVEIGVISTVRLVAMQALGIVAVKVMHLCVSDEMIAVLGTLSSIAFYILQGLAKNRLLLYIAGVSGALMYLPMPMIRATMSGMTPADSQGIMFAGIAFFESMGSMVGGAAAGAVYSKTVEYYKGFVFFVMAGYVTVAVVLLLIIAVAPKQRGTVHETIPADKQF